MHIAEQMLVVDNQGCLFIPANIVKEMGLTAGSAIHVAYLTQNGEENTFHELLLSQNGIMNTYEDMTIQIPDSLLRQSSLSGDEELAILCLDGCLLLCRDSKLNAEDLRAVLDHLVEANDLVSELPLNIQKTQKLLSTLIFP